MKSIKGRIYFFKAAGCEFNATTAALFSEGPDHKFPGENWEGYVELGHYDMTEEVELKDCTAEEVEEIEKRIKKENKEHLAKIEQLEAIKQNLLCLESPKPENFDDDLPF